MCFKALQLKVWRATRSVSGSKLFVLLTCPCSCHLVRCCYEPRKTCYVSDKGIRQCMCHMRLLGDPSSCAIISA